MIIVDFSGLMVQSVHALVAMNDKFETDMYKTMVLNSVMSYKKKFSKQYGNIVFALDTRPYWRTEVFPHYKCKRSAAKKKQQSKKSHIDWDLASKIMLEIQDDLQTVFPYKVLRIDRCEADDIIGTLCKELYEPIMIISRDHDFKQLQRYPNVKQFDPMTKKFIKEVNPIGYLKEHIIRGDAGDGICNILSASDSFYTGTKQKSITKKFINENINKDVIDFAETTHILERHKENELLIDLSKIPEDIQETIMEEYMKPNQGSNTKIQGYLIKNRLSNLLGDVQYFVEKDIPQKATLADLTLRRNKWK